MADKETESKGGYMTTRLPDGSWVRHKRGEGPNDKKVEKAEKPEKKKTGGK